MVNNEVIKQNFIAHGMDKADMVTVGTFILIPLILVRVFVSYFLVQGKYLRYFVYVFTYATFFKIL